MNEVKEVAEKSVDFIRDRLTEKLGYYVLFDEDYLMNYLIEAIENSRKN